tara:strand:- start:257 stop:1102 length:846 start_codon:yes stop_codon:yes gene_type:complete
MTGTTFSEYLTWGAKVLRSAKVDEPRREARLLLSHASGQPVEWITAHPEADFTAGPTYRRFIERRWSREPMSHITGSREFRSLCFEVTADVLDPRPDSEVLIEAALALLPVTSEPFNVLDLGTGTGCLLLSVLYERPAATGVGVDLSEAALAVARRNAWELGLSERAQFRCGDWSNGLGGTFDLVLSNPPYIPSAEINQLEPEVACHEPRLALDGGADGLDAYRAIAQRTPHLLANKGALIVEFGKGQAEAVCAIFAQNGLTEARLECDLSGRPRCFIATV